MASLYTKSARSASTNKLYKEIFDNAPIAVLEQDFSPLIKLKKFFLDNNIVKYRTYLRTHQKIVTDTYSSLKILRLNKAALDLYGAKDKKMLAANIHKTLHKDGFAAILDMTASILEGRRQLASELKSRALDGKMFDCLMKIKIPRAYEKSLKRAVVVLADVSIQKKYERHLKRLAQTDGLTRVLNNGSAMERLQEEYLRATRYKNELSILMIDMDHFKKINDQYGHQKGDIVLRNTAQKIKDNLREVDIIGRYGGDEFIVILPETSAQNAKIAAERIREFFKGLVENSSNNDIYSTISIGISGRDSKGVESVKEMIRTADRALYFAKTAGRDRVNVQ